MWQVGKTNIGVRGQNVPVRFKGKGNKIHGVLDISVKRSIKEEKNIPGLEKLKPGKARQMN